MITLAKRRIKNNLMKFYVDDKELDLISKKMEEMGMTNRSEYLRKMALQGYIIKRDFSHIDNLVYELNKIGTNINQIAKKVNETNIISKNDIKTLNDKMDEVWEKVADTL